MHEPYRFLDTNIQDAAMNMAIDEAVHIHHLRGDVPPTLRVFRWQQPSISLGRFQSVEREIEREQCQQLGVALVRRPTGGRAVYHRDEFSDERVSKHPSAACFASSTQADLTSGGFKLVGSAQVWKDDALLQQGSLPLDDRAAEFFSLLRYSTEAARAEALSLYREKTNPLPTFAPNASWEDVARAFRHGFSAALQAEFVPGDLSKAEWELAQQVVEEKYSKLEWRKERLKLV